MVNFHDQAIQDEAMDIIATEYAKKKCTGCRKPITRHIYIEEVTERYIKISAHCGVGGHNLHVFTLTEADFGSVD